MAEKKEETINIDETVHKVEDYVQENRKSLLIIAGAAIAVLVGYFAYSNFWVKPAEESAQKEIFAAQQYFKMDSIDLAINGKGKEKGFKQIADQYSSSNTGNLANYYLGVLYMKKGQFQNAIDALKKYDAEDDITGAMALGLMGDAYMELGNNDEALTYYKKAVGYDNNEFTAPLFMRKSAFTYELQGKWSEALDMYKKIQSDYSASTEGREIGKYIARAQAMIK
ncbi:MAG: tetratricopeptide repeat protein [Bacteroidia bacterium]|nr:tetratricopeptide repeat protein [Bacteroidia bacterium]HQV00127.1 tetratricopeptide repeat protein [Bacteroidia bacterium]